MKRTSGCFGLLVVRVLTVSALLGACGGGPSSPTPKATQAPTRTLQPAFRMPPTATRVPTRRPTATPKALPVGYDEICLRIGQRVRISGTLRAPRWLATEFGGRMTIDFSPEGSTLSLRVSIRTQWGGNAMEPLPPSFTTADFKVHTAHGRVLGDGAFAALVGTVGAAEGGDGELPCLLTVEEIYRATPLASPTPTLTPRRTATHTPVATRWPTAGFTPAATSTPLPPPGIVVVTGPDICGEIGWHIQVSGHLYLPFMSLWNWNEGYFLELVPQGAMDAMKVWIRIGTGPNQVEALAEGWSVDDLRVRSALGKVLGNGDLVTLTGIVQHELRVLVAGHCWLVVDKITAAAPTPGPTPTL